MLCSILALSLVQTVATPTDEKQLEFNARLVADELVVGGHYSFEVEFGLGEGLSASESGVPSPILQLDVPPSVKLAGKLLETYAELSRNEFLTAPYERLLERESSSIEFELVAQPKEGETIGLVILAYLSDAKGEERRFVRRRLELPLLPNAGAEGGERTNSHWGVDAKLLQIGDSAVGFELPRADGSVFSLEEVLGEKNVLITTYRAHW